MPLGGILQEEDGKAGKTQGVVSTLEVSLFQPSMLCLARPSAAVFSHRGVKPLRNRSQHSSKVGSPSFLKLSRLFYPSSYPSLPSLCHPLQNRKQPSPLIEQNNCCQWNDEIQFCLQCWGTWGAFDWKSNKWFVCEYHIYLNIDSSKAKKEVEMHFPDSTKSNYHNPIPLIFPEQSFCFSNYIYWHNKDGISLYKFALTFIVWHHVFELDSGTARALSVSCCHRSAWDETPIFLDTYMCSHILMTFCQEKSDWHVT